MLTETIDALKGKDVAVVDIPGEYLSVDMDDKVHIVFRGTLVEMMVADYPALYRPFVSYETGKAVLYIRLQKVLYGYLKIALLFYKKSVGYLEAYGFRINQYKSIVANMMVGGKYPTVCWHVDDLKISSVNTNKMTEMIQWLESEYGEMHRSRGKRHDYLLMWLDESILGEVRISIEEYLREVINYSQRG